MNTKPHLARSSALGLGSTLVIGMLAATPAMAGGVTAGTLIENTAVASFDDGSGQRTINSNTVQVRVDELLDTTLTSLDTGPVGARPGQAVLAFELTNPGNGPEAFRLNANPAVAGNDFDVTVTAIAVDTNNNGVYDAGIDEILPAPQTTAVLTPDSVLRVFVLVEVPGSVANATRSNVELTATALTGSGSPGTTFAGQGVDGGDALVGTTGAAATARGELLAGVASVRLVKSVVLRDPFGGTGAVPGATATFTIAAEVSGSGSVAGLVVTDAIPAGTTYVPGSLALDAGALSDAADGDAGAASNADGVRVDLGTVPAGTTRAVTFAVTINQ